MDTVMVMRTVQFRGRGEARGLGLVPPRPILG